MRAPEPMTPRGPTPEQKRRALVSGLALAALALAVYLVMMFKVFVVK
jgi:hypothetical protein